MAIEQANQDNNNDDFQQIESITQTTNGLGQLESDKEEEQEQQHQKLEAAKKCSSSSSPTSMSPINQMFNGRSVFITGASGFIGRVLLEKLLRTYRGIKRIYILMRPKKNMSPQERLSKHLLRVPIFDQIRLIDKQQGDQQGSLFDKIHIIEGDIGQPNLGINSSDLKLLLDDETLSIVYHSAATVKFDEPLKTSTQFNLIATKAMIELCKQMNNLVAFCHVSTAYVNSDIKDQSAIEERIYPMEQTPEQIIKLTQILDENLLQQIKPNLLGERPNTYTYTKALAENLIVQEARELPVAIVRPSIVVAAWREPIPGWVDNLNGPTGLILAIGKGLLRSMYVSRSVKADIIPVDTCVNTMIAASYYTAQENLNNKHQPLIAANKQPVSNGIISSSPSRIKQETTTTTTTLDATTTTTTTTSPQTSKPELKIFHCTSGDTNPITWGQMEDMFFPIIRKYPSQQVLRYPYGSFKSNKYHDFITRIFVHYLPALFIDLLCIIMGKKRQLLSIYYKLHSATGALAHFCNTNYNFKSNNLNLLEEYLEDPRDKRDLSLSIKQLDWVDFWDSYVLGARRFVLKEKDETLEESRKSFNRAYYVEMGFRTIMTILLSLMCLAVATKITPIREAFNNLLTTI